MTEDNRRVIQDVFSQMERLSMDAASLSLRIRCLIRDVLDLRMAEWKEKEGKLKPGAAAHAKSTPNHPEIDTTSPGDAPH